MPKNHVRPSDTNPTPGLSHITTGLTDERLLANRNAKEGHAPFVGTRRIGMIRQTYEPGGKHFAHQHEKTEQVYYIVSGTGKVRLGEEWFDVAAGDVVYIPPQTDHEVLATGDEPYEVLLFGVELDEDEVA